MATYISTAELQQYIRSEQGAVDATIVASANEAAAQAINDHCQRSFVAVTAGQAAAARVFIPSESPLLAIYDCTSVTSITESGTTVSASNYQLEPLNGLDGSGQSRPYDTVRRLSGSWCQTGYPGKASITVTAVWGWSATPEAIKTAARIVASRIIDERNTRGGLINFGDFAAAARRHVAGLGDLLDPLRSVRAWGIA